MLRLLIVLSVGPPGLIGVVGALLLSGKPLGFRCQPRHPSAAWHDHQECRHPHRANRSEGKTVWQATVSVMEQAPREETPEQVAEAVRINIESRLRALKVGLLIMAGIALLTIFPAGQLPNYVPGEVPDDQPPTRAVSGREQQV